MTDFFSTTLGMAVLVAAQSLLVVGFVVAMTPHVAALLFGRLALLDAMSPRYRWGLALALRERGQHADALVHLGICCQLEPDRPEALIEMARSLLVVGEGDIAREALAVALSLCTTTQHEAARGRAQALLDLVSQPDAAARRSANQGDSE